MIKITKIRDVKSPDRGTEFSSGIDFFVPNDLTDISVTPLGIFKETTVVVVRIRGEEKKGFFIKSNEGILIPSGIKVEIPNGYDIIIENKSGVVSKKGLIVGANVIDADYRGEIHLHLINTSAVDQFVELGEKICQGIVRKVEIMGIEEVEEKDFNCNTGRGEGGFGSTGTK